MKVYVITIGSYSDQNRVAVYSDKAVAERFCKSVDGAWLEEFELDAGPVPPEEAGLLLWSVESQWKSTSFRLAPLGEPVGAVHSRYDEPQNGNTIPFPLRVFVWARDEAHATKIAADKFREFVAMQPVCGGAAEEGDGA